MKQSIREVRFNTKAKHPLMKKYPGTTAGISALFTNKPKNPD